MSVASMSSLENTKGSRSMCVLKLTCKSGVITVNGGLGQPTITSTPAARKGHHGQGQEVQSGCCARTRTT